MKGKLIFFIIILFIILGIAGFWYSRSNRYSKEILKLEIIGPSEVELAEEVEYTVKYKNNGDVRLEDPKLVFQFPDYSIVEDDKPLRQEIGAEQLGDAIYPGEERTFKFKGRLLGKEDEAKEFEARLSYKPKNLSATYESETTFTSVIKKVPLTFNFDLPSKIEPGKDVKFGLNYFSTVDYPLSDVRIKVEYPPGFEFEESTPSALEEKEWEIGILNKLDGEKIEISGNLEGDIGEEKIFKAELGIWQAGEYVLLKDAYQGVEIVQPSLYITQKVNGSPEYIADPGDTLHYEIFFKNLGQEALRDLYLIIELEGKAFDLDTIRAPNADYTSGDNSIVFDWKKNYQLSYLDSQREGKVEFWIDLKDEWEFVNIHQDRNAVIGTDIILSQARAEFTNKINSKLEISQKGFFEDEVFGNSGQIPPQVGESTTYTIIWQAKNFYNEMKNVKVKAVLPSQVELTGKIFPDEESDKLSFNSKTREVVWDVGDLIPGTGITDPAPNVSFQVSLTPTAGQRGGFALLIGEAKISGDDQWTERNLEKKDSLINSSLPDDSTITDELGRVE